MTLRVALVIRHLEGLNRRKRALFPFSNVEAARWGIGRKAKGRALDALEKAGLIVVENKDAGLPTSNGHRSEYRCTEQ
jgi:hypothetical protein